MRPPIRRFVVPALSLVLLLGGACVAGPRQSTGPSSTMRETPAVLDEDPPPNGPLYGVLWQNATLTSYLSRLDPRTLLPVADGRRLRVDRRMPWTTAPDRSLALFGSGDPTGIESQDSSVYVIDLEHLRQVAVIKAGGAVGVPRAARWLGADRVLLLGDVVDYQNVERDGVISAEPRPALVTTIVDVRTRRVIAQRRHVPGGEMLAVERSRDGLVLLLQPTGRIGAAEIGLVDARGGLRVVRLDRVTAGFQRAPNGEDVGSRQNVPGLAVDAENGRAYVVAAGSPVAEITLAGLDVTYHSLTVPGRAAPSVLGMVRRAVAPPAAEAKMQSGPERHARWLGAGRLAVWGTDSDFRGEDGAAAGGSKPSGLQIIDTGDWSVRTLDPDAGQLVRAEDRLVTAGVTVRLTDDDDRVTAGDGLRIRAPGTRSPVHLYADRPFEWIEAYGRYVYADLTDPNVQNAGPTGYAVIDTRTGTVLGEHEGSPMPDLLD